MQRFLLQVCGPDETSSTKGKVAPSRKKMGDQTEKSERVEKRIKKTDEDTKGHKEKKRGG